ncbi:hypothetical protein LLD17_07130 [Lactococcus cremoris]|nr:MULTISPECIES: hypothetical protein [Lactococcus]MDT2863663.1 hypothetical protein [Lactococcus lactis]MDT2868576.1 hypothetical protein [Lactococcus lactis]MDT2885331.1 hypothetical protein [Lactococcus lactis]MDT2898863.1 hypothetical protein [Lactococcus lactis]MDT2936425.1 hypothetical protein [Lactococcus lactis]
MVEHIDFNDIGDILEMIFNMVVLPDALIPTKAKVFNWYSLFASL